MVLLAVGREEAGQEPQTRSHQSEMCLKGRKIELGRLLACLGSFISPFLLSPGSPQGWSTWEGPEKRTNGVFKTWTSCSPHSVPMIQLVLCCPRGTHSGSRAGGDYPVKQRFGVGCPGSATLWGWGHGGFLVGISADSSVPFPVHRALIFFLVCQWEACVERESHSEWRRAGEG